MAKPPRCNRDQGQGVATRFLTVKLLLALEPGDSDEPHMTVFAHVFAFDRRTYPALVKLHPNERWAIVDERRNSRDCKLQERTPQMEVFLKRAYEEPASTDGFRVLVDRLWPRGKKKADLRLNAWVKEIAPSTELRKWFDHDPKRWLEFCKRYKVELKNPEVKKAIADTVHAAQRHSAITLIYAAKDTEHNEAVVLRTLFKRKAGA
jgi:uncharacterized protein YeaO (DUF488 family)